MKNPAYMGKVEAEEVKAGKFIGKLEGNAKGIEGATLESKKATTEGNALAIKLADGTTVYLKTWTSLAS